MTLIQMSITAGVLILLIIIVRTLTLQKMPKLIFVLLWDIVLLRLFLPVNIEIPINIMEAVPVTQTEIEAEPSLYHEVLQTPFLTASTSVAEHQTVTIFEFPFSPLSVVWFTGFLLCTLYFLVKYQKEYKVLSEALPVTAEKTAWLDPHDKEKNIKVLESEKLLSPITFGIFRAKIIVPKMMDFTNKEALHFIFLHEFTHIKRKDNLIKLISVFAVCIHWFNPLVWVMYFLLGRDIEIACDEKVVSTLTEKEKVSYASTLISFADKRSLLVSSNSFSKNPLYERIESIMKYKKITSVLCIAGAVIFCTLSALAFGRLIMQTKNIEQSIAMEIPTTNAKDFIKTDYFHEYEKYGITYNKSTNQMMYRDYIVTFISDYTSNIGANSFTFDNTPDYDGISIDVRRNDSNEIEEFHIELQVHLANHKDIFSSETIDEDQIKDQLQLLQERLIENNVLPKRFSYSGYHLQLNPSIQIAEFDEKSILTQLPESISTKLQYHEQAKTWSYDYQNISYIYDEENNLFYTFEGYLDHAVNLWIEKETGAITEVSQKKILQLTHSSSGPISYSWFETVNNK